MDTAEKIKKTAIIIVIAYVAIVIMGFVGASLINMVIPPSDYADDYYYEIGSSSSHDYDKDSSSHKSYSSDSHHSSSGSGSSGHRHYSVSTDPYELAKNDPGAYYDHYEYGDNYDIDDYLETEGYD